MHPDPLQVRLCFVRHGQSEWQVGSSTCLDSALTPLGCRQARSMGRHVAERWLQGDSALLFSSPLLRARQTAEEIERFTLLPIRMKEGLREADFHVASRLPSFEHPLDESPRHDADDSDHQKFRASVRKAVREIVLEAIAAQAPALIVAHGGVIKTALRQLFGTETVCFHVDNASFTEVTWRRGRWHLAFSNDVHHLATLKENDDQETCVPS